MTISKVARAAGTGPETVRFYERSGLLPKPARTRSGYRQYPPEAVLRLRFIGHAKALGFSLREIKELLALRVTPRKSCADVRQRAQQKIREIDQRIAALARMKLSLERLSAACSRKKPVSACPILDTLEMEEIAP
jgi:MerR family mercuric resistance operon transcriptional regulator